MQRINLSLIVNQRHAIRAGGPGAVVKTACLKSRRLRVRTPLWPLRFKETNVSFPQTHKDSTLWGTSLTER